MCIEVKRGFVTDKPITAYKRLVRISETKGRSQVRVKDRQLQGGFRTVGKEITYVIGERVESDIEKTPGIYLLAYKSDVPPLYHAMEMLIPAGTRVVMGEQNGMKCYCAEAVIPQRWMPHKYSHWL